MKYHIIATFNIDISEEIAKDDFEAAKFVRSMIDSIACDRDGTYVWLLAKEEQDKTAGGDNGNG